MATLPVWAIGKHITNITLTTQSVSTLGVLADSTPVSNFFGHLEEIELEASFTFENISAMDRPLENNVPIEEQMSLRLTEYEVYAGTSLSALLSFTGTYFKYVITRGVNSFTNYGVLSEYKMSGTKPKVSAQFELKQVDAGVFPSYA